MLTFLEFLSEKWRLVCESPAGTVYHMHEIDHPTDRGRKAYMVSAYHKDAAKEEQSYTSSEIAKHATEHPDGYGPEHGVGFVIFHKDNKGKTHRAKALHVDPDWQRKGIATALYDHAGERGITVKPSSDQSEKGKLFWKGYRKHLKENEDYRGEHTAPGPEDGSPLHNVTLKGTYPEDFYSHKGFRYYSDYGNDYDSKSHYKVTSHKDKPDEKVWIHRAIPTSVYKEAHKQAKKSGKAPIQHMIQKGDWVTISKEYAHNHGQSALRGDYKVASMRVPAKHVFTNGDSVHEWGYHPEDTDG